MAEVVLFHDGSLPSSDMEAASLLAGRVLGLLDDVSSRHRAEASRPSPDAPSRSRCGAHETRRRPPL